MGESDTILLSRLGFKDGAPKRGRRKNSTTKQTSKYAIFCTFR